MLTCHSLRWIVVTALVAFALTATPSPAQVTFTGPSTINVTEDGSSSTSFFTLTNNSGGPLSNFSAGGTIGVSSGDFSDQYSSFVESPGSCVGVVADGSSCDFSFQIVLHNGAGETDADFFTQSFVLDAHFDSIDPLNGGPLPQDLFQPFVLTISDPAATPEPASLVLLGSGVLGLLGTQRRKLRR